LERIAKTAEHNTVTLIYSAKDTEHSDVKVVEAVLNKIMRTSANRAINK